METLTPEEFKKRYGEVGLKQLQTVAKKAAKAPEASEPGYISRVAGSFSDAGKRVVQGVESGANEIQKTAEGKQGLLQGVLGGLRSGLRTAGSVASAAIAPITEAPVVRDVTHAIGGAVSSIPGADAVTQKISALSQKYPEITKDLEDIVSLATLGGGTATEQTAKDAVTAGANAVGNTARRATGAVKDTLGIGKADDAFFRELVTPELNTKGAAAAIRTGKVAENTSLGGSRDVSGAVQGIDRMENAVRNVPGISPKNTNLQNANLIHERIGSVASDLESQVGNNKGFFNPNQFKSYMKGVRSEIADNPLIVGNAEKTANKIFTKFESLVQKNGHTPSGLLKARKELDSWIRNQKGDKVFSPDTDNAVSLSLRGIRQGGNDFLAQLVPDVAVKDLLAEQSALYNAIDNIAGKAAKEGGNKIERFKKANPKTTQLIKYGATAVGGGLLADQLIN